MGVPLQRQKEGRLAEWLGRALQKLVRRFESAIVLWYTHNTIKALSS